MISITGAAHRSFIFPADLPTTFEYYNDVGRVLHFLPHISILQQYTEHQYRMLYSAAELGIYQVRVICDMQAEPDRQAWALRISPLEGARAAQSEVGMYLLSGYGYFNSESLFFEEGKATRIEYHLKLRANLPIPLGLRLVPRRVTQSIARSITQWRIDEIVAGFIERSIRVFETKTAA
jgi:hypothetical protein